MRNFRIEVIQAFDRFAEEMAEILPAGSKVALIREDNLTCLSQDYAVAIVEIAEKSEQ